tara:strand:+ start:1563 stop:1685 length:123 start_codon:yes stop_codon:yes gene_type:complete
LRFYKESLKIGFRTYIEIITNAYSSYGIILSAEIYQKEFK